MILEFDPTTYPPAKSGEYVVDGRNIPRVTEILSCMLHEDYIVEWANKIGLYKHEKYHEVLNTAAKIGSYVHSSIEHFIKHGSQPDFLIIPIQYRGRVIHAFNSFLSWWRIINSNNYKILMQEYTLTCKYFGGTLDLLIEINGKTYLVDFKTSNHSSYKHFLQLSAYRYMLRESEGIEVDGCIILMLNKNTDAFEEMFLNFEIKEHFDYISQCEETFLSLVYAYYQRIQNQYLYGSIFNEGE